MLKIPFELRNYLMKFHYDLFGYMCEDGAVIGDQEFTICDEGENSYLVHTSELEKDGVFVRLPPKDNE
jgi:hypothetical protein